MKILVFNATPLIYLTKIGLSSVFEGVKGEKLTSPHVVKEVVEEGKRRRVADAKILEKLFEKGIFRIVEPEDRNFLANLLEVQGLHLADAEVLAIAKERGGIAIIDDEVARKTARVYGISYAGTPFILMIAVSQGFISKEKAKRAINEMISAGWRCSIETYVKIIEAIDKL